MESKKADLVDVHHSQYSHWEKTYLDNPKMYGEQPSLAGVYATQRFIESGLYEILELGSGQGRDTLPMLEAGLRVSALDYSSVGLRAIAEEASTAKLSDRLITLTHDICDPLHFEDESFGGCFSHMLFCMALSTAELIGAMAEVRRVLRPGGICIYTVRHVGDAHFGAGTDLGDGIYENGGFAVHFFDRSLVERLAEGFELEEVSPFEEGALPRRLWRITMRRL
jgi:SAM-dependent methyltransferase